jgi:hypothetical protein
MAEQPRWRLTANMGDASPIDYGGYFVYRDETGVYTEEAEVLESPDDDEGGGWTVYRFPLDRCTLIDGILSDNAFHPEIPAWWADDIEAIASCMGQGPGELRAAFCSADPLIRADAYRSLGEYSGFDNLDHDPITFTDRAEVEARYTESNAQEA